MKTHGTRGIHNIYTLIEEHKLLYPDDIISWGKDEFWSDNIFSYDIVHFHWPQAYMSQCKQSESNKENERERC